MKLFVRPFRKNYAVNFNLILIPGYKEIHSQQIILFHNWMSDNSGV
jgi:hypothetical protein